MDISPFNNSNLKHYFGTGEIFRKNKSLGKVRYHFLFPDRDKVKTNAKLLKNDDSYGNFTTVGSQPELLPEEKLTLRMEGGCEIEIQLLCYQAGNGAFELFSQGIEKLRSELETESCPTSIPQAQISHL